MAQAIKGLRLRPKYENLIGVAVSDKLYNIKFPNRDAKFLRDGFVLSQLDGEGMRIMEQQQQMASKEAFKEHLLKQTGGDMPDLRQSSNAQTQTERINVMLERGVNTEDPARKAASTNTEEPARTDTAAGADQPTQWFDIRDVEDIQRAATADLEGAVQREREMAEYEKEH